MEIYKYQRYLHKCAMQLSQHILGEYGWVNELPHLLATLADTAINLHKINNLEEGNGRPTLIVPGFGVTNSSTGFMRRVLNDCGHNTIPWVVHSNTGFNQRDIDSTITQVKDLSDRFGEQVNLLGQSLGGCYVRTVGNSIPEYVSNIITLGSPINGIEKIRPVTRQRYDKVAGFIDASVIHHTEFMNTFLPNPPHIPTTSLYSKNDGVVHWTLSQIIESDSSENVHVDASHFSMGFSLEVLAIIANRLTKNNENWYKLQ